MPLWPLFFFSPPPHCLSAWLGGGGGWRAYSIVLFRARQVHMAWNTCTSSPRLPIHQPDLPEVNSATPAYCTAEYVCTVRSYVHCVQHRVDITQEAKYVERWPNTTCAWAGWSRFDIPVNRYGGVHSLLICTSITLWFPTCHQASQQDNTY